MNEFDLFILFFDGQSYLIFCIDKNVCYVDHGVDIKHDVHYEEIEFGPRQLNSCYLE